MHLRTLFLVTLLATPALLRGQANDIPSAAPSTSTANPEQRGRQLLDQMVTALGGPAWLNRRTLSTQGHTAAFYRDQPTGSNIEFAGYYQFPIDGKPQVERIEFISPKGMILPGKKRDVVQVWTPDQGYELTYKGKNPLPKEQVDDYLRRRAHSIEAVVAIWLKAPGVVVVSEGSTMVERRSADKISILSANNDAVTLELDANTHLPLARTFEWRNQQFKDHDEDREEYDNYQTYSGIPTPLTLSRYRNGDLVNQRFLGKIEYNQPLPPDTFNPDAPLTQKKK